MNLNKTEIEELNTLLANPSINLPAFRKEVTITGSNYTWLQKHVQTKNKDLNPRILELLRIKH